jgi:hypothetical protein
MQKNTQKYRRRKINTKKLVHPNSLPSTEMLAQQEKKADPLKNCLTV